MKKIANYTSKLFMLITLVISLVTSILPAYANTSMGLETYKSASIINNRQYLNKAHRQFRQAFYNKKTWFELSDYDFSTMKVIAFNGQFFASMSQYGNVLSTITIQLDNPSIGISETYFSDYAGKFTIEQYHNGTFIDSKFTDIDYMDNDQVINAIKELQNLPIQNSHSNGYAARGLDVGCFIAVSGATLGVAKLISAHCETTCAMHPYGCIACIGGVATAVYLC